MLYLYSSESRIGAVLSFPSIGRLDTSVFEIRENGTVVVFLREGSFTVMLDVTAGPGNGAIVPYVNDEPFPGAVLAFALSEPVNPFSRIFQKYFFFGRQAEFSFYRYRRPPVGRRAPGGRHLDTVHVRRADRPWRSGRGGGWWLPLVVPRVDKKTGSHAAVSRVRRNFILFS